MKNFVLSTLIICAGLVSITSAYGQKGIEDGSRYGHGEDSVRCVRGLSLSHDFIRQNDYAMALPYWKVIFDECPQGSKNIYIDGVKLYKDMLEKEVEEDRTADLIDTLMLIYDRRLQNYGEKGNVRGRQGVDLLRYGRDKIENIEKAYGYLKESIELKATKSSTAVLASYNSSSLILYQQEIISTGEVVEDYLMVSDMLLRMKATDDLITAIDENFVKQGPQECSVLIDYFGPMLESKKKDAAFLSMLTTILRDRECTDSDLFFKASKDLHALAPSAESALNIAIMAFKQGAFNESMDYYNQALLLETEEDKKADYYFGIAAGYHGLNDKPSSREFAKKALSVRPDWGEPYILIGQLYADSKDLCSSIRLPNSIYWAAVDQFNKAKAVDPSVIEKANTLILAYSRYYPNREEAFFENVHEDDTFTVGCWINETTKARFN